MSLLCRRLRRSHFVSQVAFDINYAVNAQTVYN
jgi:hypothetical protein